MPVFCASATPHPRRGRRVAHRSPRGARRGVSVLLLEAAAAALGDLLLEVVFVGGATVDLWITDPGAPPVRPTKDVDVVVEVASRSAFYDFEASSERTAFVKTKRAV